MMTNRIVIFGLGFALIVAVAACEERETVPAGDPEADSPSPSAPEVAMPMTCDTQAARAAVARFGERIQRVSLLAPDSILEASVRENYEPVVTGELLAGWIADPSSAPGREVSSPWPARIDVTSVESAGGGACRVEGTLVYVTSAEVASGVVADRVPVTMQLTEADGWRVSAYEAGERAAVPSP
jgi:hypothetical protein